VYGVRLAGTRVAWTAKYPGGGYCYYDLRSATLAEPHPPQTTRDVEGSTALCKALDYFHLHGDGDLLVFNDGPRLVRIGAGRAKCGEVSYARICTILRRDAAAAPVDSVSGGLIAVRERDAVAVLDVQGQLVRLLQFGRDEVSVARLDGGRLVVARLGALETYDVSTGAQRPSRPLPSGSSLTDVDGGIAVLASGNTLVLLRLQDGHSFRLTPGGGSVLADLEPPGLYYSYTSRDGSGRVAFMSRSDLLRRLG
jgi:hypothetical protein